MMESIITILGLVSIYKSEGRARSADDFNEFLEWLLRHEHKKIRTDIEANAQLALAIKQLLLTSHSEVLSKFSTIEQALVTLTSKMDGFKGLAEVSAHKITMSNQALSILRALVESEDSLLFVESYGGKLVVNVGNDDLVVEPQYLEEDLDTLTHYGLLIKIADYRYKLARNGANYVQSASAL
ncbi:TPA: hypothetical protein NJ329_002485 [Vibrio parahaemolyticus]|nr:hypothetical protein [Vibrio parahaemolyticus]